MQDMNQNQHDWEEDPRLTAYVLGELEGSELEAFEAELKDNDKLRAEVQAMQGVADILHEELSSKALSLSDAQRGAIVDQVRVEPMAPQTELGHSWLQRFAWIGVATAATAAGSLLYVGLNEDHGRTALRFAQQSRTTPVRESTIAEDRYSFDSDVALPAGALDPLGLYDSEGGGEVDAASEALELSKSLIKPLPPDMLQLADYAKKSVAPSQVAQADDLSAQAITLVAPNSVLGASELSGADVFFLGRGQTSGTANPPNAPASLVQLRSMRADGARVDYTGIALGLSELAYAPSAGLKDDLREVSREGYAHIAENAFVRVADDPRSTFSIDVDTASYANVRRFLNEGRMPPADAVRIEELINYFSYDYAAPEGADPFAVHIEVASAPWKSEHLLLRVGLKGRGINDLPRRARNLTFLIDVSGSMQPADKLPLLKSAMRLLVDQLEPQDTVAIVVYAGSSGLVLSATSCSEKPTILQSLERLKSGGSTAGAAGIELAYKTAQENFIEGGINRVILATDGDFNVGVSDEGSLIRLIEEKRERGVFLSVLGFGTGNLQDSKMEQLANHGNGNYAYIDTKKEAHKVLVRELGGTLETIAKDVKIQIEFNPREIVSFRLIGYENRVLEHADFNDDKKDAGEIGAGHTVTALYELVPIGAHMDRPAVDPLKYQTADPEVRKRLEDTAFGGELLTVKLRYKEPQGNKSQLIERSVAKASVAFEQASEDFRFAACVAAFGMLLRKSQHCGELVIEDVMGLTGAAAGADPFGYRIEFLNLMDKADRLMRR